MPEHFETLQTKAANDPPAGSGIDFLAGWPGLSKTPVRPATPVAPADSSPTVTPTNTGTTGLPNTNWTYRGRIDPVPGQTDTTPGRVNFTPGRINFLHGWPGLDSSTPVTAPTDRTTPAVPVRNGVLELKFNDLTRMGELPATNGAYNTLKIDNAPPGTQIMHWADQTGYYLFFEGADNNKIYHYPRSLRIVEMNGQRYDIDRSRLKVNEYAMAQAARDNTDKNPFASISNPQSDALTYFKRMAGLSSQALTWQESVLRKGVLESQNPYFQIYLADVLTMEALQPLVRGFLSGQVSVEQKQQILNKLTEAQRELDTAATMSYGPLYKLNQFPPGNVAMKLAPDAYMYTPPAGRAYNPDYAFYGGAWDQAKRRQAAVTYMKGLIENNAFGYFQLPPNMAPGGQVYRP